MTYVGQSKRVEPCGRGYLRMEFHDDIRLSNDLCISVPGKGKLLCEVSTFWLRKIAAAGIKTHFVERCGDRGIVVRACRRKPQGRRGALPIECVSRYRLAGSLYNRRRELGLARLEFGAALPQPIIEFGRRNDHRGIYKFTLPEELGGEAVAKKISTIVREVDALISQHFGSVGLVHIDGKKEFGYSDDGELLLIDVCGTVEEDRIWSYRDGTLDDLSLDIVRKSSTAALELECCLDHLSIVLAQKYFTLHRLLCA